jgi:hypothetical protein
MLILRHEDDRIHNGDPTTQPEVDPLDTRQDAVDGLTVGKHRRQDTTLQDLSGLVDDKAKLHTTSRILLSPQIIIVTSAKFIVVRAHDLLDR